MITLGVLLRGLAGLVGDLWHVAVRYFEDAWWRFLWGIGRAGCDIWDGSGIWRARLYYEGHLSGICDI